jgi:2-keto-3-deoxy-L-rhamnonate aldolase RhmA
MLCKFSLLNRGNGIIISGRETARKRNFPSLEENLTLIKNRLREVLASGKPTLGTRVHNIWPAVVEAVGHTGIFDYVEFLAEYAPFDLEGLDNFCRTAELYNLGSLIKIDQDPQRFFIQRGIGSGFGGVLFVDSRSAEDARECVRIARPDTPEDEGYFGSATRRFAYMRYGGGPDYIQALREVVVMIMIEKKPAVDVLEEILAVSGIDMIQWGPSDYSMSVGKGGARNDPAIKAVEKRVIETCLKMGVPPRVEIATPDEARYYLDLGVKHFSLGVDLTIYFNWLNSNGDALRKLID